MCVQSDELVLVLVVEGVEAAGVELALESLDVALVVEDVVVLDELDEPERLSVL